MKLIAHRGNYQGKNIDRENTISYIQEAIDKGFDCEIDVWLKEGILYLGHDKPEIIVDYSFLYKNRISLWIHCKTPETLYYLSKLPCAAKFFHQNDDCTLTSLGNLWTYPGKHVTPNSIMVKFEKITLDDLEKNIYGICADDFSLIINSL